MGFDHQVAVRLDVDDVGRDAERQLIAEFHVGLDAELALQVARHGERPVRLRIGRQILAVELHPVVRGTR